MRHVLIKGSAAVVLIAALAFTPAIASAGLTHSGFFCNVGTVFTPNWVACSGVWNGNNSGEAQLPDVLAQIKTDFGLLYPEVNSWTIADNNLGTTNAGQTNPPFSSVPSGTSGSLVFAHPMTSLFVLILKGGNYFSMYLFNPPFPGGQISEIAYTMNDFPKNPEGNPPGLSHASLWGSPPTTVPEPSSMLLLASGLLGLGVVGYRRRRN